jgi:outer membrane protein OmpA-like peptidoglycan-associated protein
MNLVLTDLEGENFMLSKTRLTSFGIFMLAGMLFLSGCATKTFVRNEVATLEPKITEVATATSENRERIDAVDQRAQQGITAANAAATQQFNTANAAAKAAADAAAAANQQATTANQGVQTANNRINTIETRIAGLDRYTAGAPQSVTFALGSSTLTPEAMATLDMVASGVASTPSGYLVEIQGFADSTGSENFNITLSQRRAENVLRYLVSKSVPLYRVSIIGLGEVNPVADNSTREGREQNRRVEVRVLRAPGAGTTN